MQDYRSSKAYQRSQRLDPYGVPVFPLPFAQRSAEQRGVGDSFSIAPPKRKAQ